METIEIAYMLNRYGWHSLLELEKQPKEIRIRNYEKTEIFNLPYTNLVNLEKELIALNISINSIESFSQNNIFRFF